MRDNGGERLNGLRLLSLVEHGGIETDVGVGLVLSSLQSVTFTLSRAVLIASLLEAVASLLCLCDLFGITPPHRGSCGSSLCFSRKDFACALSL